MAKLQKPLNKTELWITQTYHGEKTKLPDTQCAVDISANVGNEVISVVDGVIEKVDVAGEYVSIIPDGGNFRILNVHINLIPVKMGQRVRVGQVIGHIAPNKGGSHLHFGLKWKNPAKPAPCPMDYFDRSIVFRTKYEDIRKIWFNGDNLNWSLFKDLHIGGSGGFKIGDRIIFRQSVFIREGSGLKYKAQQKAVPNETTGTIKDGVRYSDGYEWWDIAIDGGGSGWCAWREGWYEKYIEPVIPPEPTPEPTPPVQEPEVCLKCTEWEKRYKEAREKNEGLRVKLGALELKYQEEHKALKAEKEKVKILEIEKEDLANDLNVARVEQERAEKERLKLQEKHSDDYRNYTRWSWLIDMLNKIIPAKNDRKA